MNVEMILRGSLRQVVNALDAFANADVAKTSGAYKWQSAYSIDGASVKVGLGSRDAPDGWMTIYERGDGQLQLCMTVDDRVWENNYRLYRDRLQSYLAERGFMASAAGDGATGAPEARATPAGDRDPLAVLKDERAREIVRLRNEGYTWQEIGDAPKIMLSWGRVKNILTDIRREHPDLVKDFRRVKS